MSTEYGDRILIYRPRVRELYAAFPLAAVILQDDPTMPANAECRPPLLPPDRRPQYICRTGFVVDDLTAWHEHGHEWELQLEARGFTKDQLRTALWAMRGFPGTWQEAEAEANTYPVGSPGWWMFLPGEIVAESFKCSVAGPPSRERSMDWGKTVDHAAQLAFYQQLEEGIVLRSWVSGDLAVQLDANGNTPIPGGQVIQVPAGKFVAGPPIQGHAERIGFAGPEATIGDALFDVDEQNPTVGRLHVRGGAPRPGLSYWRVDALQTV